MKWFSVAPINHLTVEPDCSHHMGLGLALAPLPEWVRGDEMMKRLSENDQQGIKEARHAFVAEYEAASLGDPDPNWCGPKPKSIQDSKTELCILANLAFWLSRPSRACFTLVIHAPVFEAPVAQQINCHRPLLCHPNDMKNVFSIDDIELARTLHVGLLKIPRPNPIWTAAHSAWIALHMNVPEVRYALWWIALEALFGPSDARELSYRLAQRISLFLAASRIEAKATFPKVKAAYAFRSKIVHGRWHRSPKSDEFMADTEQFARLSLNRILCDAELAKTFYQSEREAYLDDLVFSN
jgi:hypothetical protein